MRRKIERARQLWRADCRSAPLDGGLLAALFGFTPTEARVALLLAQGWDAAEIAIALEVQVNTVRSHVKQLLAKSDTRRQAEFVARVWHTAVRLDRSDPTSPPANAGGIMPSRRHLAQLGKDSADPPPDTPPKDHACSTCPTTQLREASK